MKLKLTSVTRYTNDKDGKPLITKDKRPYTRLVIGAEGYEKKLSGFDSPQTKDWVEGSEVEVEVEQKGEYLNFKVPNKNNKELEDVKNDITSLKLRIKRVEDIVLPKPKEAIPYPEGEPPTPNFDIGSEASEPPF